MFPKIKESPRILKQMWGEFLPVSKENHLLERQLTAPDTKGH